jgi:hypothetical protein
MKGQAELLIQKKALYADGAIHEVVVWRLPTATAERPHGLKYRCYYGHHGERLVGYDNERGKGDHRHLRDIETPYRFVSIEQLMADFFADIEEVRNE